MTGTASLSIDDVVFPVLTIAWVAVVAWGMVLVLGDWPWYQALVWGLSALIGWFAMAAIAHRMVTDE